MLILRDTLCYIALHMAVTIIIYVKESCHSYNNDLIASQRYATPRDNV